MPVSPKRQNKTKLSLKGLNFGEWVVCPKCKARADYVVNCERCKGKGVVPNKGAV